MNTFDFSRRSFDLLAPIYQESRPGYPKEVYDCVQSVKSFSAKSHILEIGSGTGIATKEIADRWHPLITALEPGRNLRDAANLYLAGYKNISMLGTSFEAYEGPDKKFDGIFSATAFHWIDPAVKYRKSFQLLADDGLLVVYWNYYGIPKGELGEEIERLSMEFGMRSNATSVRKAKIKERNEEIEKSGIFHSIRQGLYRRNFQYPAPKYLELLMTFSDLSLLPGIDTYRQKVGKLIETLGNGSIGLEVITEVEIAVKKGENNRCRLIDIGCTDTKSRGIRTNCEIRGCLEYPMPLDE